MIDAAKQPCYARCQKCTHVFVYAHVPMELGTFARTMRRATCPMCGATSKDLTVFEPGNVPAAADR
jgi:rubredoxin